MYRYIFGPVFSRRLGTSLGIDLVKMKTCSLNCAYCECGVTTNLTMERKEYVPVDVVIDELFDYMEKAEEKPDYMTFSGSGEPTLNTRIGDVIQAVKAKYPKQKIAVLTNSTLLFKEEVQDALLGADLVIPSLDAVSIEAFERILNPHPSLRPKQVIDGIISFSRRYRGMLVIEFFVVPGVNDTDTELSLIRETCMKIQPAAVQINYLDRPGAFDWVKPVDDDILQHVEKALEGLPVEPIKKPRYDKAHPETVERVEQRILATIRRRPSTIDDLSFALDLRAVEIRKILDKLVDEKKLSCEKGDRGFFYRLNTHIPIEE